MPQDHDCTRSSPKSNTFLVLVRIIPSLLSGRALPTSESSSQERMCLPWVLCSLRWSERGGRPVYWTIVRREGSLWWIRRIWAERSDEMWDEINLWLAPRWGNYTKRENICKQLFFNPSRHQGFNYSNQENNRLEQGVTRLVLVLRAAERGSWGARDQRAPHKSHQNAPNYSVYSKREHKLPFLVFAHFVPWWCPPCSRCRPGRCPRHSAPRWCLPRCPWIENNEKFCDKLWCCWK